MPTEHISHQIEAYLSGQLSPSARHKFETHVAACAGCTRELAETEYLVAQLQQTFIKKLGKPTPPPHLRLQIRQKLYEPEPRRRWYFPWALSGRVANTVGTLAVILLLGAGLFVTIQGQLLPSSSPATLETAGGGPQNSTAVNVTATSESVASPSAADPAHTASAGDSLHLNAAPTSQPTAPPEVVSAAALPTTEAEPAPSAVAPAPVGTIAFAAFNPADHRRVYELHLINADGSNHRLFPLDGVSEPALRHTGDGHWLAYRAWGQPTSPRSLLTSDLTGEMPRMVGGFWEDAQPDWSPIENRLVFASQRESDRRWRLYTSWGDGSAERDLRREGKSPSFAPDGRRLVFEGCDTAGEVCGLWQTTLENSEQSAQLILADNQAKSPDWSPVNEQIVYMANPDDNWDLYLTDSSGRQPQRLTTSPASEGLPAWSPDGEWLAFVSNQNNRWGLWVMHLPGGASQKIYDFGESEFSPPAEAPYDDPHWWDEQLSWSE